MGGGVDVRRFAYGALCGPVLPGGATAVLFRILLMGVRKSYFGSADGGLRWSDLGFSCFWGGYMVLFRFCLWRRHQGTVQ